MTDSNFEYDEIEQFLNNYLIKTFTDTTSSCPDLPSQSASPMSQDLDDEIPF